MLSTAGLQSTSGPLPPTMTALCGRGAGTCRASRLPHLRELMQALRKRGITVKPPASHQRHVEISHRHLSFTHVHPNSRSPAPQGLQQLVQAARHADQHTHAAKGARLRKGIRDSNSPHKDRVPTFSQGSFWSVLALCCASHACTLVVEPLLLLAGWCYCNCSLGIREQAFSRHPPLPCTSVEGTF